MLNIDKINKKLEKEFGATIKAYVNDKNKSIVVTGELDNWDDIVKAGKMAVYNKDGYHVVNKITFLNAPIEEMHMPKISDQALDNTKVDVLIIGGGVIGCSVARELSKNKLNILLVEKESDVAMQASSRNDGQIHPGVDQKKMNLKLKYELMGNKMYGDVCKQLNVPFERCGQLVGIKGKLLKPFMEIYAASKRKLGVWDTKIISKEELYKQAPYLNEGYDFGLSNHSTGIVCPYGLTIAYAENAISNGVKISLDTCVLDMEVQEHKIVKVKTNRGVIYPKVVVNASGVFSDKIAQMANDEFFSIHPRKGTDIILDKKAGYLTQAVCSTRTLKGIAQEKKSNTKGGGIMRTVDNNILMGPDAHETFERENYETTAESINKIFEKQNKAIEKLSRNDIITYFTGVRASNYEEDFIIEKGRETTNIVHLAAIQSPGLTAAPAIALEAEKLVCSLFDYVEKNPNFNPIRESIPTLRDLDDEQRDKLIKNNPDYGVIVCRCEQISKGEIIDCLKRNLVVKTMDGIKRRVRCGMGRCQGGFCSPLVSKIISEYENMDIKDVTKNGNESFISYGKIK